MTDFRRTTNRILATAKNGRIGIRAFETHLPDIARQIRQDAQAAWLECWGGSFNFDEHESATIVDRKLLNVIGRLAQYPIRNGRAYHAGLIHTYGYLLSNLKTRFGYKRQRWLDGRIEQSLGLAPNVLSASPQQGTLLQNLTYLLTRIAFDPKEIPVQIATEIENETIPTSLLKFRSDQFPVTRITERVQRAPELGPLKIITDIVRFKSGQPLETLLVYSIKYESVKRLITCFPMSQKHAQELCDTAEKNDTPIRPRFNLAFPDFPTSGLMGKRTVAKR